MRTFAFECHIVVAQLCLTLCNPMDCSTPGSPVLQQLPEFAQTHIHWVPDAIQPSHPLSPPSPRVLKLSQHQGLFSESAAHIRGPKYWSFSFSTSPSSEYWRLIPVRMDWFDLLAVQRTLKSFLQHHNLKVSVLQHSAFFMVQLLHLCMSTGKNITLCWAPLSFDYKDKYVGKWIALRIW